MGKPVGVLEEEKKGERPSEAACVCVCVCVCVCAGPHDVHYYIVLRTEQTPAE